MENWHVWVIVAVILFIIEIFTPAFVLACFGVACVCSGFVALLGMGLNVQIVVFCLASLLIFWKVRPFFLKYLDTQKDQVKTNVDALIGKTGTVTERIDPTKNKGRVIVNGEDWRGISVDETVIEAGEKITVIMVEGTKLFVKANQLKGE